MLSTSGGTPHHCRNWNSRSSWWCTVSNALTMNSAHVGWLWYILVVSTVQSVNRISRHPTPSCNPNFVFTPWLCITLASGELSILLINWAIIHLRQIPCQWFGLVVSWPSRVFNSRETHNFTFYCCWVWF
jgi:hypothetical protein